MSTMPRVSSSGAERVGTVGVQRVVVATTKPATQKGFHPLYLNSCSGGIYIILALRTPRQGGDPFSGMVRRYHVSPPNLIG